jgi:hypothetical protein
VADISYKYLKDGLDIYESLPARERKRVTERLTRTFSSSYSNGPHLFRDVFKSLPRGVRPHVFLSHSHRDKPFVRALARKLSEYGVGVWVDEGELKIGDSLIERISAVIQETPLLIAVLSPTSVKSNWVKEELHLAMTRQIQRRRVKVLPVMKEVCKVPDFLQGRMYADFTTPYRRQQNFPVLLESIVVHCRSKAARRRRKSRT